MKCLPLLARNTRQALRRGFTRTGSSSTGNPADVGCGLSCIWEVRMARYLLIESRDPFDSNDVRFCCDLAQQLAAAKHEVTLFLVQNGVFPARPSAHSSDLARVAGAGVRVLADSFSLRERGIDAGRLASSVAAAPLDIVIDALAEGAKVIWH